ncbi:hypothetical protein L596_017805 [Steinernema carpocapsae]|uniref:Uncharacterized protein n=1 Tax=Steinernema carpocapsae TaxID=34508 RepID=A0A4U5N2Q3_STECR|nr:hypothetical protein L596_017805 [Steinernema carpocapsae]
MLAAFLITLGCLLAVSGADTEETSSEPEKNLVRVGEMIYFKGTVFNKRIIDAENPMVCAHIWYYEGTVKAFTYDSKKKDCVGYTEIFGTEKAKDKSSFLIVEEEEDGKMCETNPSRTELLKNLKCVPHFEKDGNKCIFEARKELSEEVINILGGKRDENKCSKLHPKAVPSENDESDEEDKFDFNLNDKLKCEYDLEVTLSQ